MSYDIGLNDDITYAALLCAYYIFKFCLGVVCKSYVLVPETHSKGCPGNGQTGLFDWFFGDSLMLGSPMPI